MMKMKTIKYLGIFLLVMSQTIGMTSCSGEDYHTRLHELILKDLDFTAVDEEYKKEFRNEDLSNYSISSDQEWCHVSLDADLSRLYVSVDANETFDDRTATVTMKDMLDGTTSRTFTVRQKQCDAVKVKEGEYRVSSDGGLVEIDVNSNIDYKVEVQNADWITVVEPAATRGLKPSKIVLKVDENKTEGDRNAIVRIYNQTAGVEDLTVIYQEFKAKWSILKNNFTIDEQGGEISIYVQTNVSFDSYTIAEDGWVTKAGREKNEELGVVVQRINIAPLNKKLPSRSSTVTLQNTDWNFSDEIYITQTRNLYIEDTDFNLLTTQTKDLKLHNAEDVAVAWRSSDETVAMVDDGKVLAVGEGTATIRVLSADGKHSDKVDVTVEAPQDLGSQIAKDWSYGYDTTDDNIRVVSSVASTITNNSSYEILLKRCTLYRDEKPIATTTFDAQSGLLGVGKNKRADFANLVLYKTEEVPDPEPEPEPEEPAPDPGTGGSTAEPAGDAGGDTPASPARRVTRATVTKVDTAPHSYYVLWEYSYCGETFTLKCTPPASSAARKVAVKARARRR